MSEEMFWERENCMNEKQLKIVIGCLLHDIGKILFRADDGRNHSRSGFDFLKEEVGITDLKILEQVLYHHASLIRQGNLSSDSLAYITYFADNIAAAADRRKSSDDFEGFDKYLPLESIFNRLNGNEDHYFYQAGTLDPGEGIHYPVPDSPDYDDAFYMSIRSELRSILSKLEYSVPYVNSLLETMEATLSFIPSSTAKNEYADISLYDHVKITAAVGSCILSYFEENEISDYSVLFGAKNAEKYINKKMFLLYSMDMSGIQSFIYGQFGNEEVLKNLRARSFYLEIMLEHFIDELLEANQLSRANLLYSGGGHAYLILPDTKSARTCISQFRSSVSEWLLEVFQTDLFLADGYTSCSAADLKNQPDGSYSAMFKKASSEVSERKIRRYDAGIIRKLNQNKPFDSTRECKICHRSNELNDDNICPVCEGIASLSGSILSKEFFVVSENKRDKTGLRLGNNALIAMDETALREQLTDTRWRGRVYGKNRMFTGRYLSTKLWVGDYSKAPTLSDLVNHGEGIHRLGVLRADVDNLGQAFVNGFESHLQTLSRSATFSRKLSMFFKFHINHILEYGSFSLEHGSDSIEGMEGKRSAAIIYSGGDDVFVVGAWKDVLEFSIDLYEAFRRFTQGTLTLSAGFGIYKVKYPISYIAEKTGELEDQSKDLEGKNAVTLFDNNHRYKWEEFTQKVIDEKYRTVSGFFQHTEEHGKNFLYNMLELLRNREERINIARLAYLLSRMEPDYKAEPSFKEMYTDFSKKVYQWMQDPEDTRQLITAIYLHVYRNREEE